MVIGDALSRTISIYPERVAVIDKFGKFCPTDRYTYKELGERVNRLANGLISLGLEKGDRVALMTATRMGFYISYLAIVKAGLIFVPVNALFGGKGGEFIHLMRDSGSRALIVDADIYQREVKQIQSEMPGGLGYFIGMGEGNKCPYDWETLIKNSPSTEPKVVLGDEDLVMLLYTSGTTGLPKGTMLTHHNVSSAMYIWMGELRLLPHYKLLVTIPSATSGGIGMQTFCTYRGMTLVLSDFEPKKVCEIIQEEKINITMFAPTMTKKMVTFPDARKYDYSSLRYVITSAAPISAELIKEASSIWGDVIIELFGTTETLLLGTILQPEERALEGPLSKRLESIGKSSLGYEVRVIDYEGNEVGPGGIGELLIRGDPVAKGYWNMSDAPDFEGGWWHSGDLVKVDEGGYIYVVDRKKDMIISGGQNIYPREIEDIISAHPGVFLVGVIGVPDEEWGESVKAVIVPKEEYKGKLTEQEIIEWCQARLSSYKKPRSVDFINLSEMPLMGGGYKVVKRELRDRYREKYLEKTGKKIERWGVV